MRKTVTLYNVIFPIWMILLFPMAWLIVLPANFIADSLVLLLAFAVLKLSNRKTLYKQSILKVWGFGFLADILACLLLLLVYMGHSALSSMGLPVADWLYDNLISPIGYNPFKSAFAVVFMLIVIALAGLLIYVFNYRISLKNWPVEDKQRKKAALMLALITAPYTLLIPTAWTYRGF